MTQEEAIALGHEAEIWLNTPLGKYMIARAHLEVEKAKDALAITDPLNTKEIMKQQNIIARHDKFVQWLQDVITNGRVVYDEYVSEDE